MGFRSVKQRFRNATDAGRQHGRVPSSRARLRFVLRAAVREVGVTRGGKPTLNDVATRAGVSTTTASYILNGRTLEMRISTDTEQRVRRAAVELAYRPNRSARSLRTATTATVGMISDFIAGGHVASHLLIGANEAARGLGHLVVIGESGGLRDVEERFIEDMLGRQVDGIVYATLAARAITIPPGLAGQRVVLLNCMDPGADLPSVMPDDVLGGRVAARALLDAGCTERIYVVGEDPSDTVVAGPARLAGVHDELREAGLDLAGVVPCEWGVTQAHDAVAAWLAGGTPARRADLPQRPDRHGHLPGPGRAGAADPRRRRRGVLRRLGAGHLVAAAARLGGAAVRRDGPRRGRDPARPVVRRAARRPDADDPGARGLAPGVRCGAGRGPGLTPPLA